MKGLPGAWLGTMAPLAAHPAMSAQIPDSPANKCGQTSQPPSLATGPTPP